MLDEILLGLSATLLLRMANPSTSTNFPEVNQTNLQLHGLPSGYYNQVYFKQALKRMKVEEGPVDVKTLCNLSRIDDLYYEFHVVYKDLIRDLLNNTRRTECAELARFDVVHSVEAVHQVVSLLEQILEFLRNSRNFKDLGDPMEVYDDMRLLNSIVNICHSVIFYNALPYRSFPDALRYLRKLKTKKVKEIVMKNMESISQKYSSINKEHEELAERLEDSNILKLILFRFFYESNV